MTGYPIAALAKLYEQTGKAVYLDGAKRYADVYINAGEPGFVSAGCGKALWGLSILYRLTGETKYDGSLQDYSPALFHTAVARTALSLSPGLC